VSTNIVQSRDPERERRQQQENEQQQALMRSRLVQRLLQPTPDLRQYLHDLVYTQAVVIAGTEAAAFLLHVDEANKGNLENCAHIRPDGSAEDTKKKALQAFSDIIAQCINENRDGIVQVSDDMDLTVEPQFCLVTLLRAEGRVIAGTAVITRCRDQQRAQQRLDIMQVVAGYFDYYMLRRGAEQMKQMTQNHQDVLQYATAFGTAERFINATNNLANEIANRTGATRVSIGWEQGWSAEHPKIKLKGMSHTEQFDKKQELSVQLIKVMEECLDQQEIVQFDSTDGNASTANVTREAQALSRMEGGNRVLSLPLRRKGDIVGIMTLEFPPEKKPSDQETTSLAVAAELLGPILFDRFNNDRWITTKMGLSVKHGAQALIGKQYWLAKLLILCFIGLMTFLIAYRPVHLLKGRFEFAVEPEHKRVIQAKVSEVSIKTVLVQPGDLVEKDQLLLTLDDTELSKKLAEANAKKASAMVELRSLEATIERNGENRIAEAKAKKAEIDALQANINLLEFYKSNLEVRSPMAGVVMAGDLKDRIGKPVQIGETLFEVADPTPENLRVQIAMPERLIANVKEGVSVGEIRTQARPDLPVKIKVVRVVPSGSPKEGKNVFTVYADITDPDVAAEIRRTWRAGMAGEAAIENEPRSLLAQWTQPLVDWARVFFWI
jgi:hypothetical protein